MRAPLQLNRVCQDCPATEVAVYCVSFATRCKVHLRGFECGLESAKADLAGVARGFNRRVSQAGDAPLRGLVSWLPVALAILLLLLLAVGAGLMEPARAYEYAFPPYPLEYERFGVCGTSSARYDMAALGAGWYVYWYARPDPPHPEGMGALQIFRVDCAASPPRPVQDEAAIRSIIQANPAAVWRVGNEPDSPWMDDCTPDEYAQVYHGLYHLIKGVDPLAQVAFGGLVQATPLRLLYLDFVWQAYGDRYGADMPVDVWTVHSFILPETRTGWGANIPAGMGRYAHLGIEYEIRDHDDVDVFIQRFVDLRRWMAAHGQRDKPLIVPEYGILMWPEIIDEDGEDFSDERVIDFMYATFDFFLTGTDAEIGYPADDDRLVQAWAWYSLDDNVYHDGEVISQGYGGDLFTGAYTKTMTPLGEAYAAYVHERLGTGPAYTDLYLRRFRVEPAPVVMWDGAETLPFTITAEIANHGRQAASSVEVWVGQGDPEAGGTLLLPPHVFDQIPGRYEGASALTATWTPPGPGAYTLWVEIDPAGEIVETDVGDNRMAQRVLVAAARVYLPVVGRGEARVEN